MANARAGRKAKETDGAKKRRSPWMTALFVVVPAAVVALPSVVLLFVGFLPTFGAYLSERGPERAAATTVGAMNLAGVIPFAIKLWRYDHSMAGLVTILSNPLTWLAMYGAAALGWGFYYVIPNLIETVTVMRAEAGAARLRKRRQEILEEWGPKVAEEGPGT